MDYTASRARCRAAQHRRRWAGVRQGYWARSDSRVLVLLRRWEVVREIRAVARVGCNPRRVKSTLREVHAPALAIFNVIHHLIDYEIGVIKFGRNCQGSSCWSATLPFRLRFLARVQFI